MGYQRIIEFLWIIKVHTSIWNDLQTTKGLGIRPPRPTTLTRPFRTSWKNPENIQRTSREHLEKIWRKSNVQHLWSSEHILRASWERQKHLRTSENIYGTTENIWHHSENNWEPIIDSLNKISKFILKCCMEWDDYLRPNQFLHHLMIKGMILSPPRDLAPPVFPLAWKKYEILINLQIKSFTKHGLLHLNSQTMTMGVCPNDYSITRGRVSRDPKKYLRNFLHDPLLVCQMMCHGRAEEQRIAAWSICCKGILCCCKIDIWSQRDLNLSAKAMAFRFRICSTMNKHNYELWCKLDISTFRNNSMVLTK